MSHLKHSEQHLASHALDDFSGGQSAKNSLIGWRVTREEPRGRGVAGREREEKTHGRMRFPLATGMGVRVCFGWGASFLFSRKACKRHTTVSWSK